jgi:MFS family permease
MTFFVSAVAILTMTVPHTTLGRRVVEGAGGQLSAVWAELREGIVYLFGNRVMMGVLLCMGVVQLGVGAINVLWVPFMQRTFGLGPEGLGAVDTAQGLGMVLGGVVLGFMASRFSKSNLAGWSIAFIGGMIVLIGLAPPFSLVSAMPGLGGGTEVVEMTMGQRLLHMPLMLLLYSLLLGVAIVPAQSSLMTMMQLAVPDLKRGRVSSAQNALTTAVGLVSMAVAASLGEVVALRIIYVAAGLIVILGGVVGLVVLVEPEVQPDERGLDEAVAVVEAAAE